MDKNILLIKEKNVNKNGSYIINLNEFTIYQHLIVQLQLLNT